MKSPKLRLIPVSFHSSVSISGCMQSPFRIHAGPKLFEWHAGYTWGPCRNRNGQEVGSSYGRHCQTEWQCLAQPSPTANSLQVSSTATKMFGMPCKILRARLYNARDCITTITIEAGGIIPAGMINRVGNCKSFKFINSRTQQA